jgi:hypothetical protein
MVQTPFVQVCPDWHLWSQEPQLLLSVPVSTQELLQQALGDMQIPPHEPPVPLPPVPAPPVLLELPPLAPVPTIVVVPPTPPAPPVPLAPPAPPGAPPLEVGGCCVTLLLTTMPFWTDELSSQPLAPEAQSADSGVLSACARPWLGIMVISKTTRVLLSEATPSERTTIAPLGGGAPAGGVQVPASAPANGVAKSQV